MEPVHVHVHRLHLCVCFLDFCQKQLLGISLATRAHTHVGSIRVCWFGQEEEDKAMEIEREELVETSDKKLPPE